MKPALPAGLLCVVIALAGCGSDEPSSMKEPDVRSKGIAKGETGTWEGSDESGGSVSWSVSLGRVDCGISLTVPEDAYTEEYADREGEIVKAPADSQFCLVEVGLTNESKMPQTEAPQPGNIITPDGEFAPDSDLEIFLDDYYASDDSSGHFIDDPVQPGQATKSFQLYSLAKDQVIQSVVFSDEEPQLELQNQ